MKVIMYHHVKTRDHDFPYFQFLNTSNFEKQINHLLVNHRLIGPSSDLITELSNASEFDNAVLLTFDDGLKCHYHQVLPILKKHEIQSIFFVPTAPYTDSCVLGVHKIHLMLGKMSAVELAVKLKKLLSPEILDADNVESFKELTYLNYTQPTDQLTEKEQAQFHSSIWIKRCLNYFIDFRFRDDVINRLFLEVFGSINEAVLVDRIYLSVEEIKELVRENMIIGSHAKTHRLLSKLDMNDTLEEIDGSFDFLETLLPVNSYRTFCYPYGGSLSFNSNIEKALTSRNVRMSFNVESRDLTSKDFLERPQALPRYDCNEFPFGAIDSV